MPVVNGKEFPYTKKGMAAAKAEKEKGSGEKPKLKTIQQFQKDTEESMGRGASRFFSREKGATGGEANRAQNAYSNSNANKKQALRIELAKRKQKADAPKKRRAGE